MNKIGYRLTLIACLFYHLGIAQIEEAKDTLPDSPRAQYIKEYNDHVLVQAGLSNRSLNLFLFPRENGLTQFLEPVLYRPSVQNTISIGASFKGFGLGFGFKLNQNPLIGAQQGESDYMDFRVVSYGRKIGYDFYFQQYTGYFINNLNDFFEVGLSGTTRRRRDDIRLKNYSANVYLIARPERFSYRAAFVHDERQLQSAGSLLLTASLGYFSASGDSPLVPEDTDIDFDTNSLYSDTRFYTFSLIPGYAYTLVSPKRYYANLGASGLAGIHYFEATSERLDDRGVNYFLKGILRASAGFSNDTWAVRVAGSTDIQGLNTRNIQFQTHNLDLSLLVAYRFPTNWLKGKKSLISLKKEQPAELP